jgi:hypothetical protein
MARAKCFADAVIEVILFVRSGREEFRIVPCYATNSGVSSANKSRLSVKA